MSRFVWPYYFSLQVTGLEDAKKFQKVPPVRDKFFPKSPGSVLPVALRWSHLKELGFPREPFQVFRRRRNTDEKSLSAIVMASPLPVSSQPLVNVFVNGDFAYVVNVAVGIVAGNSVTLTALDVRSKPIPGQAITLAGSATVQFRCAGIASIRSIGTGFIGPVDAIPETAYANLPDWEKIQTVGLPLKKDEIGTSYKTPPQGIEPASLDGVAAAAQRMTITRQLQLDPPATGIADFPLPAWPLPEVDPYIADIRSKTSLVPMIERCLQKSVDTDPLKMQVNYLEPVKLDGIKQADIPGAKPDPNRPTEATLPITGVAMLAVSTDSWAAVSLGYGTVDIPPLPPGVSSVVFPTVHPPVDADLLVDYMVTAPFLSPFYNITLAALSGGHPRVQAPAFLQETTGLNYPPPSRNKAGSTGITVSWPAPAIPQGFGVLTSRKPGTSEVINLPRAPLVKGFDAFIGIPLAPPQPPNATFADNAVRPLTPPPAACRYLVAGLDVFGNWSNWILGSASITPASITKPGLRNVSFIMDAAHATGHLVPATMRIEFGWDWRDRAPGQIRFTGLFVPAGTKLGPVTFLTGFAMKNTGPVGAPVVLTFQYANQNQADTVAPSVLIPTIDAGHTTNGPVQILRTNSPDPNSSQVQYRVDIQGLTLDFATANELDFALYATATEQIRPGEFSDATDPVSGFIGKIVRALDPIPPVVTFTPPSISWTALPDATGTARGLLQWVQDPKATGYYVWEATESGLRHMLAPATPDPPDNTPLVLRGASLKTLIDANQAASLEGFARLNKDPIVGTRTEIRVPASASTLYVYRVSAVSAGNVESARSSRVAFFGVPRRNIPGTPRLLLRKAAAPQAGIQVIALPVETGAPSAGFRVFRVRKSALSLEPSMMGPPKIDETNAGWHPFASATLKGTPLLGKSVVDTTAVPSWYPYFYRIIAVGEEDLANGKYKGESEYSNVQSVDLFPQNPPQLAKLLLTVGGGLALVTLTTDLPATSVSPAGSALVEVMQTIPDSANPGKITSLRIISLATDRIVVGTVKLPPPPPPPPFPPQPPPHPRLGRTAPDVNGRWTLFILIPYIPSQKGSYFVRLTDPLQRQSSESF